jgi:hypothetical protein
MGLPASNWNSADGGIREIGTAGLLTPAEHAQPVEPATSATSWRGHNRRKSNHPTRQAIRNTNTGLSKTPAAMIRHCALIETLPMA